MRRPTLTSEQQSVVDVGPGAHLLAAPPGSGKTEVLVRRAIHLIEESPAELFRVLALTYTIKAAGELRLRVAEAVEGDDRWRVTATTFHSFALDMLEHYGAPVGVGQNPPVFDDDEDKRRLVEGLLEPEGVDLQHVSDADWSSLFRDIARLKTDMCPPESAPDSIVPSMAITMREAYEAYETALANAGGIDFEGMLFKANQLLAADPWVAEHYQRIYRHVLVDEGQEMTLAQYELIRGLCGNERTNVFIVADVDQSINRFAGGGPEHLQRFLTDYAVEQHQLTTNFRSAERIVAAAAELGKRMETGRVRRAPMVAATLAPGWVGGWAFHDEEAEAEHIAGWVEELLECGLPEDWLHAEEDPRLSPEDVCVFGRTRYLFEPILRAFEGRRVPVLARAADDELFASKAGRVTHFALRLIVNPRDVPSRRRLVDELGTEEHKLPERPAVDDLTALFRDLSAGGSIPRAVSTTLTEAALASTPVEQLIAAIAHAPAEGGSDNESEAWAADQAHLLRLWTDYGLATRPAERSLSGYLKHVARLQRAVRDDPGVRLLTPHRARGLAFKVVVVSGMNEGTFPYYRATTAQEVDEERRVVYVAATRAARGLAFTRPRSRRTSYGNLRRQEESRFVSEMGVVLEASSR